MSERWRNSPSQGCRRLRVVDLTDVTSIDRIGEEVLYEMVQQQASFIATGLYTRHLLETLQAKNKADRPTD
ncbi:hypothetical protein ACPOL_1933 [Acidisarcina polymorpha]|uniref:STAS domain-containing protein n=1 Tax=Acidisarcina polymorpha TaxID=2211140 RepID=A0A2Z5FWL5_9BACT|nr:hypothetical protein ACPOL_1933 [Acidisarcina polymorpha]